MTTYNHTDLAVDGTIADAADVTTPDGELDAAIGKYFIGASAPTVNDDSADGYTVGRSWWFNTATGKFYRLTNATVGAAVWSEIPLGLSLPVSLPNGGAGVSLAATGPGYVKQATLGATLTVGAIAAGDLPSSIDATKIGAGAVDNTEFGYLNGVTSAIQTQLDGKASVSHNDTHVTGGGDAFSVSDLLDAVARIIVQNAGASVGTRRGINLIPGNNVMLTMADDAVGEKVNVTISAQGGSIGTDELTKVGASGTPDYLNSADFERGTNIQVRRDVFTPGTGLLKNRLINGGFDVWQRGASFTSATTPANNDDTYLPDRWNLVSDGNNIVNVSQQTASPPAGARYFCDMSVVTTNKKFGLVQYLDAQDVIPLRGKTLSLSFQAKTGAGAIGNIRAAVLEWTGTADSLTSDVVNGVNWQTAGVDPTLATSWAYLNTPSNLALTTSWATFKIEGITVGASANNLAVFIWSDDVSTTASDTVDLATVQLEVNSKASAYLPRPIQQEVMLCERYCEKSYNLEVAPGTSTRLGAVWAQVIAEGTLTRLVIFQSKFRVAKLSVPTISTWSDDGTANNIASYNASATKVAISSFSSTSKTALGTNIVTSTSASATISYIFHYMAEAEL